MQIAQCSNLHDQSLFLYFFSEMTASSLITNVNAKAVEESEFREGMTWCSCLAVGLPARLLGSSKTGAALHAYAFPVHLKS